MVRYRLYRSAVACASGPVGEALTRQLLLSPLCSGVVAVGRVARQEFESLSASKKLRMLGEAGDSQSSWSKPPSAPSPDRGGSSSGHTGNSSSSSGGTGSVEDGRGEGEEGLSGVNAAFCVLGDGRGAAAPDLVEAKRFAELCDVARVPHVTLLSCIWADPASRVASARVHGEIAECFMSKGFERLSIFQPSLVLQPSASSTLPEDARLPERIFNSGFPLARQFLPNRYREVSMADIVLAMRLNVELCYSPEKVEKLNFVDMMAIIGKEDTV
mmetsp:Transcript_105615/g.268272  ORF Transcript_105615/g.268272 Transcript_105615/m.268272 type:complete len:272 (-) Transcript_105615:121-936(-)